MTEDIEARVLAFLKRELLSPGTALSCDDDLLSSGLLDSMGMVRLATFVESEFGFKMKPADFVVENFQNVAVLAEYVQHATQNGGP